MLSTLRIQNLAIVDQVHVDFAMGLNVITGETGAGKSMLADALSLILGDRADKSIIRSGTEHCQVEAVFSVTPDQGIDAILEETGLPACDDTMLVIRRRISSTEASRIYVNDAPATLQVLKRLGDLLVDLHGPHEHQSLLSSAFQRDVLDAFGHLAETRGRVANAFQHLQDLRSQRCTLDGPDEDVAERLDLLAFQIHELEQADLETTDEEELEQEHGRVANATRILELADMASAHLMDDDLSAFNKLAEARRAVDELASLLPEGEEWQSEAESLSVQIKELVSSLHHTVHAIDADPQRLEWIEDRMAQLQKLKRKYGKDISAMLDFLANARQRHAELEGRGERLQQLDLAIEKARKDFDARASELTKARTEIASRLAGSITDQLVDLGFEQARFSIEVSPANQPGFDGADRIDFGFSPNTGEPLRSLKDIASSGEISRVMLAVKAVLAEHDRIPVLVFDEIDANLGGQTGNAVGRKLAAVSRSHQVICITHLPQVAVHGTTHFVVSKSVHDGRTRAGILSVEDDARAEEIARMLGGRDLTSVTLQHAREMLKHPEADH